MAAFSYPHPAFVFNSFLVPTTSNNMSSLTEEGTIITTETCFSPVLYNEYLQEIPLYPQIHESSCNVYEQLPFSCASTDDHDHDPISLTAKQGNYSVSSPIVVEPVCGDQPSTPQLETPVGKKRKNMDVKVEREGKVEKERKCISSLKKVEERKTKAGLKKQKKVAEISPSGVVHVRARRGQATDSHSLAERVRREKISVRMKILQSLVPGCDKVTGKALILDEIIKYVQALQTQVEFLAAKLSFVSPAFNEFGVEFNTNLTLSPETCCSDFQFPAPNSLLLHEAQEQRSNATFQDNGNSFWCTDGGRRHELVNHQGFCSLFGQPLRQQEKQNRSTELASPNKLRPSHVL